MQEENQGRKVSKKPREGRNSRDVDPQMHVDMDLAKWRPLGHLVKPFPQEIRGTECGDCRLLQRRHERKKWGSAHHYSNEALSSPLKDFKAVSVISQRIVTALEVHRESNLTLVFASGRSVYSFFSVMSLGFPTTQSRPQSVQMPNGSWASGSIFSKPSWRDGTQIPLSDPLTGPWKKKKRQCTHTFHRLGEGEVLGLMDFYNLMVSPSRQGLNPKHTNNLLQPGFWDWRLSKYACHPPMVTL